MIKYNFAFICSYFFNKLFVSYILMEGFLNGESGS